MFPAFRPLPVCPAPVAADTLQGYGCRVLAFVLEHGCTATLSDEQLHQADHAYPVAIGAWDIEPLAVDRLTAARHLVLAAIHFRRTLEVPDPVSVPPPPPVPVDDGGRLTPITPAPFSRPPAPRKVEINF